MYQFSYKTSEENIISGAVELVKRVKTTYIKSVYLYNSDAPTVCFDSGSYPEMKNVVISGMITEDKMKRAINRVMNIVLDELYRQICLVELYEEEIKSKSQKYRARIKTMKNIKEAVAIKMSKKILKDK